jgi:hypothetical protein
MKCSEEDLELTLKNLDVSRRLSSQEVYLVGEVLQLCPPDFAEWTWFIFWPLVENS